MNLSEFMETDIFKNAANVKYVGTDSWDLDYDDILLDANVIDHRDINNCLIIRLNVI